MTNFELNQNQVDATKKAAKITKYVLAKVSKGETDMYARVSLFDKSTLSGHSLDRHKAAFKIAGTMLENAGVTIDTYSRRETGDGDFSDRIAVTEVNGTPIAPTEDYKIELQWGQTGDNRSKGFGVQYDPGTRYTPPLQ